nr:basic proline-rich protein-like [Aegilops tauschii subsp. strangulata]
MWPPGLPRRRQPAEPEAGPPSPSRCPERRRAWPPPHRPLQSPPTSGAGAPPDPRRDPPPPPRSPACAAVRPRLRRRGRRIRRGAPRIRSPSSSPAISLLSVSGRRPPLFRRGTPAVLEPPDPDLKTRLTLEIPPSPEILTLCCPVHHIISPCILLRFMRMMYQNVHQEMLFILCHCALSV